MNESYSEILYNNLLLSECRKHLSLCMGIAQHSGHRCSLCTVDMNDACLCLDLLWSLLNTSSWGHCCVCQSDSVVFPYLFRRRSTVRWSCVSDLEKDERQPQPNRGYCTQHLNTQTLPWQDWHTCSLETRAQTKKGRGRDKVTNAFSFFFFFLATL